MKTAVVLGAGVTGLSVAWKLSSAGWKVHIIDSAAQIGGVSSSFSWKGMKLDYGPHKIYSQLPVLDEILGLFKEGELNMVVKKSKIRLWGQFFRYPLSTKELLLKVGPLKAAHFGLSYAWASALSLVERKEKLDYEGYLKSRFGSAIYDSVFGPYAWKVWGNPRQLDKSLAESRIAVPSLMEMIKRLLFGEKGKEEISAAQFYYPKKGIGEIPVKMLSSSKGTRVYLNTQILRLIGKGRWISAVEFSQGKKKSIIKADCVVSTIPILSLLRLLPKVPNSIIENASRLHHRNLILLYLEVNKDRLLEDSWIFFPESNYPFNRISEQKGFSAEMVGEGKTVLCVEVTCDPNSRYWKMKDNEILSICIGGLEECGVLSKTEVDDYTVVRLENAYPVFSQNYKPALYDVLKFIESYENLFTLGRQGLFSYTGMIDCIDMGSKAATFILSSKKKANWEEVRKSFENYVTID